MWEVVSNSYFNIDLYCDRESQPHIPFNVAVELGRSGNIVLSFKWNQIRKRKGQLWPTIIGQPAGFSIELRVSLLYVAWNPELREIGR